MASLMRRIEKLIPTLLLLGSLLIFFYVVFQSEVTWGGSKRDLYTKYYFISCGLVFLSLACFVLPRKFVGTVTLFLGCLGVALYLFEAYLIFQHSKPLTTKDNLVGSSGKVFDYRSRLEVFNDMSKEWPDIAIRVPPSGRIGKDKEGIFPLAGISAATTINCNENGEFAIYLSDRYGFNNPDSEWDAEEIDFVLVGDSFTHGSCVDRPADIASALRRQTGRTVLNLGYTGNGPLIEYATLREYSPSAVKHLVWLYFEGNDQADLVYEMTDSRLQRYILEAEHSQDLVSRQDEIDVLLRSNIEHKRKAQEAREREELESRPTTGPVSFQAVSRFLKLTKARTAIMPPRPRFKVGKEVEEVVTRAAQFAEANNSELIFVFLPEYWRYKFGYQRGNYAGLRDLVDQLGATFVDIPEEVFEKQDNPLSLFPFGEAGHYTEAGYWQVAEAILEAIRD